MAKKNEDKPVRLRKDGKPDGRANKRPTKNLVAFQVQPDLLMGEELTNAKMATFMMAVESIKQQSNIDDINSLYNCLNQYIALCGQANMRITNMTAYEACGVSKATIELWSNGQRKASQPEYKQFADTVRGICRANREQLGVEGKINPVAVIWWQKAHDGMREDTGDVMLPEEEKNTTAEDLSKKYETL